MLFLCRIVKKTEQNRLAVREQINYDNKQHELIESVRNEEKEKVLKELAGWKSKPVPLENDQSTNILLIIIIVYRIKSKKKKHTTKDHFVLVVL